MTQIDASIALGAKPVQIESPMNQLAKLMQMQNYQQQGEMNRLKMDEYQRGIEQERGYNALYQGAVRPDGTLDWNALITGAARGGFGSKIPGLQEGFAKSDKAKTDADQAKFKLATDRYNAMRSTMGALAQEPTLTKAMVEQAGQALVQQGILPPEMYQKAIGNMPDDPQQLRMALTQGLKAQMSPEQIFTLFAPKATQVDNGQQIGFRDTNPNSPTYGQNTAGAPVQKVATPGEVQSNARGWAQINETKRHHGVTEQNAANTAAAGKWTYDSARGGLVNTQTGEFKPATQNGKPVGAVPEKLGEGAKKQVTGIDALHGAIEEYKKELSTWSKTDSLRPDKRAAMGTKYKNMMLQAKEAYNLGVLNGPDLQILESVVTDPVSWQGTITSNNALTKQAAELDRMMQKARSAVSAGGKPTAGGGDDNDPLGIRK